MYFVSLLSNVFLHREKANAHIWKSCTSSPGGFTSSLSARLQILLQLITLPCSPIWLGLAPRVEAFCWLAVWGRRVYSGQLQKKGN